MKAPATETIVSGQGRKTGLVGLTHAYSEPLDPSVLQDCFVPSQTSHRLFLKQEEYCGLSCTRSLEQLFPWGLLITKKTT